MKNVCVCVWKGGLSEFYIFALQIMEPTTVGSLLLENDLHENELEFESHMGRPKKKCPRYFRRDSRENPRDLNMCCTGRSAALSRRRKSMPPIGVLMKRVHETGRATAQICVKAQ